MFLRDLGKVAPLYIGKAETIGKGNRNLSANINNLDRDLSNLNNVSPNYSDHSANLLLNNLILMHKGKPYPMGSKLTFVNNLQAASVPSIGSF